MCGAWAITAHRAGGPAGPKRDEKRAANGRSYLIGLTGPAGAMRNWR